MFRMDPTQLAETLEQLDQARRDHATWHDQLVGTLICRPPPDSPALRDDGYRGCRFGRWYYEQAPAELRQQPAFAAIGAEHRRLHGVAARLLGAAARGAPISREEYDELADVSARLRLELDSLRHEIQAALGKVDMLTGAYEREALLPELREWHELVWRGVQRCCIAFMDLDHFKNVNDTYGHLVGDQVLTGAARCVAENLRPYDKLFRYGGDEFLIVLPAVDLAAGRQVIERIRQQLAGRPLVSGPAGETIRVTGSFGLATLDPEARVEESIERGDTALLLAKSTGRNRVVTWDPAIETQRAFRKLDLHRTAH